MFMDSDNQLIQKIKAGESRAFQTLVYRYQDHMFSVCLTILKNRPEAQEAAQDTFIKVFKSINSYKEDSKLSSWLYKIAYRTSLDYIRKRKHTQDVDDVAFSLTSDDSDAQQDMETHESSSALLKLVNELPADEAGLIRMFYLEELSIRELEQISGLTQSNIKVKLFRARNKLKELAQNNMRFSEVR